MEKQYEIETERQKNSKKELDRFIFITKQLKLYQISRLIFKT